MYQQVFRIRLNNDFGLMNLLIALDCRNGANLSEDA